VTADKKGVDARDERGHDANYTWCSLGDQPGGASSKPSKEKPGATVQPADIRRRGHPLPPVGFVR
jgi:hypothetical protein